MKLVKVPYNGKGYTINYKLETIDLSMTPVQFLNVYSIFVDDPVISKIVGDHFTILHNQSHTLQACYEINSPGNLEEMNLKKQIAQQVLNDPG
ncbi:MAG: hypothetical protein H0U44_00210 [Flavisolibacter sp.]|jgi:hypothetical protein|nr:hypothetical protein [Flavisolibacter sp.]